MAYETLKSDIQSYVKQNGEGEITGDGLQSILLEIVNTLGTGFKYVGVATPSTSPGTPSENVFYIGGGGIYANFGSTIEVEAYQICVFAYNGSWSKSVINVGSSFDVEDDPAGASVEFTFYSAETPNGRSIKINKDVSDLSNEPDEAISQWWAAQKERKINLIAGYTIDFDSLDASSPSSLGVFKAIQAGQIIDSYTNATSLIFGTDGGQSVTINKSQLPYTAAANLINVKSASETLSNVSIKVRGSLENMPSYININEIANHPAAYANAAAALADVPEIYRRKNVKVVYFDDDMQLPIEMLCIDDYGIDWDDDWWTNMDNWAIEGPIRTEINEGGTSARQLDIAGDKRANMDDFLNVNVWNATIYPYETKEDARLAVPIRKRKVGLTITYLLDEGWITEQFTALLNWGTDSVWVDDDNWKVTGPVSVSQNTTTDSDGNGTINIGGTEEGKYAGADKLIRLVAIASSRPSDIQIGECYYNTNTKHIIKRIDSVEETEVVPFYNGAIYQYDSYLYVWNGEDLVFVSGVKNNELYGDKVADISNSGNTTHLHSGIKSDNIHYIGQQEFNPLIDDNISYEWGKHVIKGATYNNILPYLGKTPCTIVVDGDGPQAFRIQGKNKASGNMINLCDFGSNPQSLPYTLTNPRPDLELIELNVYISNNNGTDGNLSIKFTKTSPLKALKTQADKSTSDITKIQSELEKTNSDVTSVSEDVFNIKTNDLTYNFRKEVEKGVTYNMISYLGKTPCTIVVGGDGPQAFRIQGKNKKTGNYINICDYLSNPQELPITIQNPRPDLELIDLILYISQANGIDGNISVKIIKESPFIKDNPKYKGVFQFGRGLNLHYDTGSVDALDTTQMLSLSYWYGLYDALVAAYPDYVTKVDCDTEFLTNNPSVTRPTELENMPIYIYKFIPKYPDGNAWGAATKMDRLKVFITTGTHPEYIAMWDCYQTMLKICSDWNNDDNLRQLRHNVEFYIMPCSGPWGITHATRTNHNGVDLNRNMPTPTWKLTPQGDTYSGPEPASEYETKLLVYYLNDILPLVFIDHHNFGVNAAKEMMFGSSYDKNILDVLCDWEMEMDGRLKKLYPTEFPQNDTDMLYQYVTDGEGTGTRASWTLVAKRLYGMTIETTYASYWNNGVYQTTATHIRDAFICSVATNIFLNALLIILESVARTTPPIEII